jgi:hypothetical protein
VFRAHAKASIRQIAVETGLSKSSVHRLRQALARRDVQPESWLWETEAGRRWLVRLVVASLYIFGFQRGVGAETIREFLCRLRLEAHVGRSPSALRGLMAVLEPVLLATAAAGEREGIAAGEMRPIIGAVDATCLEHRMLVCLALASGSLLAEEVAAERSSATWHTRVQARLEALGVGVFSLVSDRAKALIQLAETGLDCLRIPAVFHLLHDLVKRYALSLWSRLRQARQALCQAPERLGTCQAAEPSGAAALQAQACVAAREAEVKRGEGVHRAYRPHLEPLSLRVHPGWLWASTCQSAADVERQLRAEIAAIETLVETQAWPGKQKALHQVRRPLAALSAVVDFWWQGGWQDFQPVAMTPLWKRGWTRCCCR